MSYLPAVVIAVTSLAIVSCRETSRPRGRTAAQTGETRHEVALRYAPKIAELRAKLERAAAIIDAPGSGFEPVTPDPPMAYDAARTGAWRGNADFLAYQLLRPVAKPDIGTSGVTAVHGVYLEPTAAPVGHIQVALTLAQFPPAPTESNEEQDAARDAESFKRALATRYVIVVKTSIEVLGDNAAVARLTAEALAIDIEKLRVVATASVLASGPAPEPPPVMQPHMPSIPPYELLEDTRKQLLDKLAAAGLKIVAKPVN